MKNILLVDDEEINRLFISTKIRNTFQIPYNLLQVTNGFEAIDAMKNNNFDCVIMDYGMPGMNGGDAMQRICHDMGWNGLGIGYTAYNVDEYWNHFLKGGANRVFLKHDELDVMLDFIKNTEFKKIAINR